MEIIGDKAGWKGNILSLPLLATSVTIHFFSKTAESGDICSSGCGCGSSSSKIESSTHDEVGVKE
jgi:hypothetical protein